MESNREVKAIFIPKALVGVVSEEEGYILSSVAWLKATKQTWKGYSPLSSVALREALGRNGAERAMSSCMSRGFLQTDNSWMVGEKCKGYRLTKKWAKMPLERVELRDLDLVGKLAKNERERAEMAINGIPARRWIYENLASLSFRGGFMAVLASHGGDWDRINARIQAVGRIEDRDWWFSVDKKTGRLFHNAATLPKDCRRLLLVDGRPTAEVDIANCQPFLLSGLYPSRDSAERRRLLDLCVSGRFYENMAAIFQGPNGDPDKLKEAVYRHIMYGRAWHLKQPPFLAFRAQWPELGAIIGESKFGKDGHRELPQMMQKAEADLMIGKVVPRLMREMPLCKALTVHDSLLVPVPYAGEVADIIRDEIAKEYGCCPPVRVKEAA